MSGRSRFDQAEPERTSRFDRRSRSPAVKKDESRRSRSPIARDSTDSPSAAGQRKLTPAEAAAAAAARINAQIAARKGIQHVDVPPIRSSASPASAKSPAKQGTAYSSEVYQQDGDYIKDIEVNDLRNRYTLTKGSTQKMIKEETGADVTTRGEYYPDKSMATAANPPLYLHVTSTTKEGLEKAVAKIDEMMKQELPNLVDERRFRRREPEPFERDELGRRKWPEERIPVDLEPINGFNLRAQVVGAGGAYVKHIQGETRCRVQIKGRGSGFMEPNTGQESDEPMYLHVAGPDPAMVKKARELCEDLLKNVKAEYEKFKERPQGNRYGHSGYSNGRAGYGGRGDRDRNNSYGYGYGAGYGDHGASGGHGDVQSPVGAAGSPGQAGGYDAQQQWYASNGGQDPYAVYGGYQNYLAYYWQYYQQTQQGASQASPPGTAATAPPPPPPEAAPGTSAPPLPPSGSPPGGYNAVPPPPGL
ncbi:hypothetical protein K469DRAFT_676214 [Zopfia rhizophila CBS 207.26]|uniref:K Homology domain-containing protein n=1 Tax=Zopfia rhizophila CBS 207.26 TaxID=1314779 RepID=A0A6A6DIL7_9PEZI|nr:hypothetical protein K469DRAFT_676214 [Zopfia rhizophila CBS 207.26]